MATDPNSFHGLEPDAQAALAAVIDSYRPTAALNTPDVRGLVRVGFGWSCAFEIGRQVRDGGNAGMLQKLGLRPALANSIATACDTRRAERIAAMVARLGPNTGRTMPRRRAFADLEA